MTAREAAAVASEHLGYEVVIPCPNPEPSFAFFALGIELNEGGPKEWRPHASWTFVPPDSITDWGVANADRHVQVAQYGSETTPVDDAEEVSLGIGEDRALRKSLRSEEPPGSDMASGETLYLYAYSRGQTFIVAASGPLGESTPEPRLRAMLAGMLAHRP